MPVIFYALLISLYYFLKISLETKIISFTYILDSQLNIGNAAAVEILRNRVANIHRIASLKMIKIIRHVKRNRRQRTIRLILLDKLQFQMTVVTANLPAVSVIINILRNKHRRKIPGAKRLKLI